MKKSFGSILLTVLLAAQLCGCGAGENELSGNSDVSDTVQDTAGANNQDVSVSAGGILDPFAVQALEGKDNSLDAYSAVARFSLQTENPENALEGGKQGSFLGVSRAYCFKKHLFSTAAESWDELSFVASGGEKGTESFDLANQLWGIGPAAGTDHYVSFGQKIEEGAADNQYLLTERDENNEKIREFPLEFLKGEDSTVLTSIRDFGVDRSGAAHLVQGERYLIVSQEGEILAEYAPEDAAIRDMVTLYDGRIAFWCEAKGDQGKMSLQCLGAESDMPVSLASWEKPENNLYYVTLFDEDSLLYADKDGLYRCDLSGKNPELLYSWVNHGIIAHEISGIQTDGEGKIALLYSDSEQYNYLCLEPTTEEVPICKITMNVRDFDVDAYQWLVAEFNRRYPSCHIELAGYSFDDKTALLTQLTAGNGPVLLDPSWLGFEELEELWEPLDTVMEQLGIMEELYPNVMEMGKINGTLYGMVRDFYLSTVVAGDPDLKDWDYDTFFQCIQDTPGLESICNYYAGESGHYYLLTLLEHGLDDTYFIIPDGETGALHFDSDRFRRFLDLAEKYCSSKEGVQPGTSLLEGKTLCNRLSIIKPEYVAAYRTIYGEGAGFIGYPTKDGATHFMVPSCMLAIRKSATKEEKEAAAAFLTMCLSYKGQVQAAKDINFRLSVRRDVLEEQIASMNATINISEFGKVSMGGNMNIELDRATLLDMIDQAQPLKSLPAELSEIIDGELDLYLSGEITEDMLIDHLENRVGLYLGERN